MKKKVGHLPTEFIEITPLNSAEFLYSKGKQINKGTTVSSKQTEGLSTPSITHDELKPVNKASKTH
jgi:hypothetical protein